MVAKDFEYDGEYLKDWGCVICQTDISSSFSETPSVSLVFNKISQNYGKKFNLTTSYYDENIQINFQICKNPCDMRNFEFSTSEIREIKRWLNRPNFHKFKLIQPKWADFYMMGSFNITELKLNGRVYVLNLTFTADSPLSYHEDITYEFDIENNYGNFLFYDISDEIGYIYPYIEITCLTNCNLTIHNSIEDRTTEIKGCYANEIITFTPELLISTSNPNHKIQNDFNYIFFRIANEYKNRKNIVTFSNPVHVKITYTPLVKVVI